jgi:hypothetical protein
VQVVADLESAAAEPVLHPTRGGGLVVTSEWLTVGRGRVN